VIGDVDLDHIAVAVDRHADAWPCFGADLGGAWYAAGPGDGFNWAQLKFANGMRLEVLEPAEVERNDFLRRFLDRHGRGPHHLTFKVGDITQALDASTAAGCTPVNVNLSHPGWKEAFLHPKDALGVVVQLAQAAADDEWSPPVAGFPAPRRDQATLLRVSHAVASLEDGLALFGDLLGGRVLRRGSDDAARWVELAGPGPGRVRLLEATSPASPITTWLDGRSGRVHHVAFAIRDPGSVEGAVADGDGQFEIAPHRAQGTRVMLARASSSPP
jgi:catechol 2,3-dioxygenase-like lactoylglutathione lyase family enzyme